MLTRGILTGHTIGKTVHTRPADSSLRPYSEVSFKPTRFLLELIYHTFHLLPLIVVVDGWRGVFNRSFLGLNFGVFQQTVLNALIYALTIIYGKRDNPLNSHHPNPPVSFGF